MPSHWLIQGGLKPGSLGVPPSVPEKPAAKTVPGKWDLITPQGSRAGAPSAKVKTAPKAPKHTVAAPKRKKQILPVTLVNRAKRSLPKPPVRAPRQRAVNYPTQPLIVSSPGPQDPNQFLWTRR